MQRRKRLILAMGLLATAPLAARAAADDAYSALMRYSGSWKVTLSAGRALAVVNHCTRTGLFFVCEQAVDAKPAALVIFLPASVGDGVFRYRTQTLDAAGDPPGAWHDLTITGDRWVYESGAAVHGHARRERTINTFSGPDFIHFETQTSSDGETWTTTKSGDERRAP